jgi:pimeloyl-ACP methyl ester carboxylesterase
VSCTPETLGTRFEVPFLLLHGGADLHTLPSLAEQYLAAVDAPATEFVRLPGGGHMAMLTRPVPHRTAHPSPPPDNHTPSPA